ncbi:DUF192 domain-containing protein [Sulfitobacter sp. LCG007]
MRVALVALSLLISGGAMAQNCREDSVTLRGDWGQARFNVEIADDVAERAQGLMNRKSLPSSAGMLFVYERPQTLSFWMRNTLIPLDLLFMDQSGKVVRIHRMARPLDETPIVGGEGLTHVLEINGGLADRLGIVEGSVMRHPSFPAATALWPC